MANPGVKGTYYEDDAEACSPAKYKKIETFHTDDRCCYEKWTSPEGNHYLERKCYCKKFDNNTEQHYSPQCYYLAKKDTKNDRIFLLLKCSCDNPTLISADSNYNCAIM
ncbi:hypothetical protein EB796_023739 [Bugula neritina]|uniref:Uncharacterized protein n=1 Tax=Bugula neritina TaxID=10212 RepID=A0A7J7IVP9_BUGNE|nr:hypothetical protein EB796_023739 [Bugula neritina]